MLFVILTTDGGSATAVERYVNIIRWHYSVEYKFKTWEIHKTGIEVTEAEKIQRAEEIADKLSSNRLWKSHSRPLNIEVLEELKLKINDFGGDADLTRSLRAYHRLVTDYVAKNQLNIFVHTRSFI
ncbi:hypothetical protein AGMMS50293_23390 [Spirochaetia bacterium]|nr:hypothetical protein AGMMS50293_23390 [Spirochaetia bacterium]